MVNAGGQQWRLNLLARVIFGPHRARIARPPVIPDGGVGRDDKASARTRFIARKPGKAFRLIALHIAIGRGNKRDACPLILLISQIAGPAVATQGGVFWHSNFGAFIPVPPLARIAAPAIAGNIGMRWHTDRFTAVLYALIAGTAIPVITPDDMAG